MLYTSTKTWHTNNTAHTGTELHFQFLLEFCRYQWVRDFRNAKEAKAFALEEEVGDVRI